MATKTFNIGECAIGGRIKITIIGTKINIQALDWFSKKEVLSKSFLTTSEDVSWDIKDYLNELTHYCYAEKCLDWILKQSDVKKELFRNS